MAQIQGSRDEPRADSRSSGSDMIKLLFNRWKRGSVDDFVETWDCTHDSFFSLNGCSSSNVHWLPVDGVVVMLPPLLLSAFGLGMTCLITRALSMYFFRSSLVTWRLCGSLSYVPSWFGKGRNRLPKRVKQSIILWIYSAVVMKMETTQLWSEDNENRDVSSKEIWTIFLYSQEHHQKRSTKTNLQKPVKLYSVGFLCLKTPEWGKSNIFVSRCCARERKHSSQD